MYNTVLLTEIAKLTTRNTGADSYTAIKIMACHKSRWKAATKSKDWGIRRRTKLNKYVFIPKRNKVIHLEHFSTKYFINLYNYEFLLAVYGRMDMRSQGIRAFLWGKFLESTRLQDCV